MADDKNSDDDKYGNDDKYGEDDDSGDDNDDDEEENDEDKSDGRLVRKIHLAVSQGRPDKLHPVINYTR